MPTIKFHNIQTNEIIEREMNVEELAQWEAFRATESEVSAQTETAKEIAHAKLAALGLTTDDLNALGLGAN